MKHSLSYYRFARKYISKIKEWFKEAYGIDLRISDVVKFVIHSIKAVDTSAISCAQRNRGVLNMPLHSVIVDKETYKSFIAITETYKTMFGNNASLLLTALIINRAINMPQIERSNNKPPKLAADKPKQGGYINRLNLKNKFFFYDKSSGSVFVRNGRNDNLAVV